MPDNTSRFSNRASDYSAARPGYPPVLLDLLKSEAGLSKSSSIADIGSGTGISALLFLDNGNTVFCVEPNKDMRAAAEAALQPCYTNFRSSGGSAENTLLESGSVDIVTAAQAFHWFDRDKAAAEFRRILKPGGFAVLIWNERKRKGNPFFEDYEKLILKYARDYSGVRHWNIDKTVFDDFFGKNGYHFNCLKNSQYLDRDGFKKRAMSTSYLPWSGEPGNAEMTAELETIFSKYQENSRICFEYDTKVYIGRL
ncbi:MAG: class I SAM-dependent methyltransferase [Brevinematales bacterium]|jgi:ubiquinone/menaquinone biosynthesis C-methylase UbiE